MSEMFIHRLKVSKEKPYTCLHNTTFNIKLSPTAFQLLFRMLHHAPKFRFYLVHYSLEWKIDKRAIRNAIKELVEQGYCYKQTVSKRMVNYYFFEDPMLNKWYKIESNVHIPQADTTDSDEHFWPAEQSESEPLTSNSNNENNNNTTTSNSVKQENDAEENIKKDKISYLQKIYSLVNKQVLRDAIQAELKRTLCQFDKWYEFMIEKNPLSEIRKLNIWIKSYETFSNGVAGDEEFNRVQRESEMIARKVIIKQPTWAQMMLTPDEILEREKQRRNDEEKKD